MCWVCFQYFSEVRICMDPQVSQWEFRASDLSWTSTQPYACKQPCACRTTTCSCDIKQWQPLFWQVPSGEDCSHSVSSDSRKIKTSPENGSFQQTVEEKSNSDSSLGKRDCWKLQTNLCTSQGLLDLLILTALYLWGYQLGSYCQMGREALSSLNILWGLLFLQIQSLSLELFLRLLQACS